MLSSLLFYVALAVSLAVGFSYFRDLGDLSQMVLSVKRENMLRFIRNENVFLAVGLGGFAMMVVAHFLLGAGPAWLFWVAAPVLLFFYAFTWIYVHLGLRNQQNSAHYYSIAAAQDTVAPAVPVIVFEHNGVARAHPVSHLLRPHLAGDASGLDGENVVMTFCAMANLGLGYIPEIQGQHCALEVLAQHGNNLLMRDNTTNEPIQQIYGRPEGAGADGAGMRPWPTFRMSFSGFQKAYPNGTVFLNRPPANPLLRLFDLAMETAFVAGIARQHNEAKPIMDNMSRQDDRLPAKTYVWGIDIDDDAVCFTRDFLVEHDNLVNTSIGGRDIVLAWHPAYESLGAWYKNSSTPITNIDFFGNSDQGQLARVERLKAGMFWHVWFEFYPHTDINRISGSAAVA